MEKDKLIFEIQDIKDYISLSLSDDYNDYSDMQDFKHLFCNIYDLKYALDDLEKWICEDKNLSGVGV